MATKEQIALEVTSTADTGGIEKASASVEKLGDAQESIGSGASKSAVDYTRLNSAVELGTKAFGVAQEVIGQTLGRTLELANGIDGLSQNLGISAEEASKLTYATSLVGIEQGQLEAAMVGAIKKGITPNLEGLGKLSAEYLAIEDPIKRSQYLMQTFGKQGLAMGDLLERGADGINALADEAANYGVVLNDEAIQATKDFNIQLKQLEARADGVKSKVGMMIVDVGNKTIDYYDTIAKESQAASQQETLLRQAVIANAFAYGEKSIQTKAASDLLTLFLQQQQAVITQFDTEDERVRRNTESTELLAQAKRDEELSYYGSASGLKAYYEGMVAANDVMSPAEEATRDLTAGTQDLTKAFIYNQAIQNLSPEAALEVARSMGMIKTDTLAAAEAIRTARTVSDKNGSGFIDAGTEAAIYASKIREIEAATRALQGMKAEVTITTINEYIDKYNRELNAEARPGRSGSQDESSVADNMRNRGLK